MWRKAGGLEPHTREGIIGVANQAGNPFPDTTSSIRSLPRFSFECRALHPAHETIGSYPDDSYWERLRDSNTRLRVQETFARTLGHALGCN